VEGAEREVAELGGFPDRLRRHCRSAVYDYGVLLCLHALLFNGTRALHEAGFRVPL